MAFNGTAIERNTIISRISDSPITMMPNGSSASPSRADASMLIAAVPVTSMSLTEYFFSRAGRLRPELLHQGDGGGRGLAGRWDHLDQRGVRLLVGSRLRDGDDARELLDRGGQVVHRALRDRCS